MKRPPLFFALVVVPAVVLVVLHLAGARACLGVLSGTRAPGVLDVVAGVSYALAWFATVLVAPVVVLGSLLAASGGTIRTRIRSWRTSSRPR